MKWELTDTNFYTAVVEEATPRSIALAQLCEKLAREVLPQHDAETWDCVRAEIWPDSGRLIVFPSLTSSNARIEKSGCQIVFVKLLNFYETLADSDISDEEFTDRLLSEEREWATTFLNAAKDSSLKGMRIIIWDTQDQKLRDAVV